MNEFTTLDRLKAKLEDWASWEQNYRPNLSGSGSIFSQTGSHDFDSLFSRVEHEVFKAIDAAIDDLPHPERQAIRRRYLHTVWTLPGSYPDFLDRAHVALIISLPKRNVIL